MDLCFGYQFDIDYMCLADSWKRLMGSNVKAKWLLNLRYYILPYVFLILMKIRVGVISTECFLSYVLHFWSTIVFLFWLFFLFLSDFILKIVTPFFFFFVAIVLTIISNHTSNLFLAHWITSTNVIYLSSVGNSCYNI